MKRHLSNINGVCPCGCCPGPFGEKKGCVKQSAETINIPPVNKNIEERGVHRTTCMFAQLCEEKCSKEEKQKDYACA